MQCNAMFGPHATTNSVAFHRRSSCWRFSAAGMLQRHLVWSSEATPALLRFFAELLRCAHNVITPNFVFSRARLEHQAR